MRVEEILPYREFYIMPMKYVLTTDGDGHWYVIPADKQQEFAAIVEAIGKYWDAIPEDDKPPEIPEYATPVNGSPSRVEFEKWVVR